MILAHQHLAQFESRQLRSAVAANTAIKLAGGLSDEDAKALAANMGTTPEFLLSMKKDEAAHVTEFACSVRSLTHTAVRLTVPLGVMEGAARIKNPHVFHALVRRNWELYCADLTDEYPPDREGTPGKSPLDNLEDLL